MNDPNGLRERKKARLHQRLLDTARNLFEREPYEAVTYEQIGELVDCSPQTIFRYFPRKLRLFVEATRNMLPPLELLAHAVGPDAAELFAALDSEDKRLREDNDALRADLMELGPLYCQQCGIMSGDIRRDNAAEQQIARGEKALAELRGAVLEHLAVVQAVTDKRLGQVLLGHSRSVALLASLERLVQVAASHAPEGSTNCADGEPLGYQAELPGSADTVAAVTLSAEADATPREPPLK